VRLLPVRRSHMILSLFVRVVVAADENTAVDARAALNGVFDGVDLDVRHGIRHHVPPIGIVVVGTTCRRRRCRRDIPADVIIDTHPFGIQVVTGIIVVRQTIVVVVVVVGSRSEEDASIATIRGNSSPPSTPNAQCRASTSIISNNQRGHVGIGIVVVIVVVVVVVVVAGDRVTRLTTIGHPTCHGLDERHIAIGHRGRLRRRSHEIEHRIEIQRVGPRHGLVRRVADVVLTVVVVAFVVDGIVGTDDTPRRRRPAVAITRRALPRCEVGRRGHPPATGVVLPVVVVGMDRHFAIVGAIVGDDASVVAIAHRGRHRVTAVAVVVVAIVVAVVVAVVVVVHSPPGGIAIAKEAIPNLRPPLDVVRVQLVRIQRYSRCRRSGCRRSRSPVPPAADVTIAAETAIVDEGGA